MLRRCKRMRAFFAIFPAAFIFIGTLFGQSPQSAVEAGKVIVQLRPDAFSGVEMKLKSSKKTSSDTSTLHVGVKSFDKINLKYGATAMKRVFPDAGKYEAKHRKYGLHLWYEIDIPENENPETAAATYRSDENIQAAEPRYKIRRMAMPAPPLPPAEAPNDPSFGKQWGFNNTGQSSGTSGVDIRLPDAWERAKTIGVGNRNVIVAVVDGGVYYDHEDLKANIWVNEAEANGTKGIDDDGNGYIDDVHGYNFVSLTGGVIIPEDHATHVAGIVAAVTNNGTGVSGIAGKSGQGYGVKVMNTEILSGDDGVSSIGPAYAYAADNGAVISQNSWGYERVGFYNSSDLAAINYFINEAGRDENGNPRPGTPMVGGIVIFAAGNDGQDAKWYPGYFNNVFTVAAVNHYGKRAYYSNYGSWVNISAPGGDVREKTAGGIYSTSYRSANKNYYEYMQGTSMACPHVSGVAAMILSVYGYEGFTPDMLRTRLLGSATSLAGYDPTYASRMGAGLLNASAALAPDCSPAPSTGLTAEAVDAVSGRLEWAIPQAASDCEIIGYLTACATEMITEENFSNYLNAPGMVTAPAGSSQQGVVKGLLPGTTYYTAIRNVGHWDRYTVISDVATFTTRSNVAPAIVRQLPDITMRDVAPEKGYFIGDVFSDNDGDAMTYTITAATGNIAQARIDGDSIRIRPVWAGETVMTLTADDGNTGQTSCSFTLTVTQNHAPVTGGLPPTMTLIPYTTLVTIDLSRYTVDSEGDSYTFLYNLNQKGIVTADITGNVLTIDPRHHGFVTLTITVTDPYAASSSVSIDITVEQKYSADKPDKLLIYPNPVYDILNYSFVLTETASVYIRLVNASGATMHQRPTVTLTPGTYYYDINLSYYPPGMYFLQYIKNDKKTDTKKVLKE